MVLPILAVVFEIVVGVALAAGAGDVLAAAGPGL
jgi:hypothetical protein